MSRQKRLRYGTAGSPRRSLARRAATLALVLGGTTLLVGVGQDERRHVAANAAGERHTVTTADRAPVSDPRTRAISRDGSRTELRNARDARLQTAAQRVSRARDAALRRDARLVALRAQKLKKEASWAMPLTNFRTTGTFGMSSSLWSNSHTGLDLAAPEGTVIRSIAAGSVREAGSAGAYGNRTVIRTDDGLDVWYCHQSRQDVAAGDRVAAGQRIGAVGSTGNVTGPHLHLEIRPAGGGPVDPAAVLAKRGLRF